MRVQRWRNRLLTGRNAGSKSSLLASGAMDPTTRASGISYTPPKARPSGPAAFSIGAIEGSRRAPPVRTDRTERRNARNRGVEVLESPDPLQKRLLEQRLLALGVEEVKAARVEPEPHVVTCLNAQSWIDTRGDLVAADLAV